MSQSARVRSVLEGSIAGLLAWIVGYAITYAAVGSDVREGWVNRGLEFVTDEPATYEIVGWVFYNAHFVDTAFEGVPFLRSANAIGGDGFTAALYLVPPGLLLVTGLAVARYRGVTDATEGILTGLAVVPGYLLASAVGVFLVEVSVGDASGGPALLPALLLAGITIPVVFATAGSLLGALTAGSGSAVGADADTSR
ncbi:hypothetical protein [Natronobiforma cellulositropha]|uniref:hypothetical protein n=1 Tax=Natronobiforma cellulositropha TaxID=1679076 RepID=UPI0021D5947E|nr:hypothetical protein [Natronobiforma cellulositropha]